MLTLDQLKKTCDSAADADERLCAEYEDVRQKFEKTGIKMDEAADLMFSNHVMCVLKRIHTHEFVDELPEELFSELTDEAKKIAGDLLADVFAAEGIEPNKTEVLMLATHIGVAMATER